MVGGVPPTPDPGRLQLGLHAGVSGKQANVRWGRHVRATGSEACWVGSGMNMNSGPAGTSTSPSCTQ